MLRLILTRHAKSRRYDPPLEDYFRDLKPRGYRDSVNMGAWLKDREYEPDVMCISSAVRARETFEGLCMGLGIQPDTTYLDRLYHAPAELILETLRAANGHTVLLVGHNPGIGEFATRFAELPADHEAFARYPTTATTVYEVTAPSWAEVEFGRNPILDFAIPRELAYEKGAL